MPAGFATGKELVTDVRANEKFHPSPAFPDGLRRVDGFPLNRGSEKYMVDC